MRKIWNLLFIIIAAVFLCSCSKEEKTNQTEMSLEEASTNDGIEDQEQPKEEVSADEPSQKAASVGESETNPTNGDDILQKVIDMVLAKQIIEESDIPVSESDSEYFVPKTEDYMLEWRNYEEDGFQMVILNSFDEEGKICQYIEKRIYESEDKIKELPKGYTIVGKVGYRDNEDLSGYQNINKINAVIRVSQDIINMDSSTEDNIVYWDKEELISSRESSSVKWLSDMDKNTVIEAMKELYQQGQW